MSGAELFSQIVLYLAAFGCAAAFVVGYTKARAGVPVVTLSPYLLVCAILVLFALAYLLPDILAGPRAGRASCASGSSGGGCLFWTIVYPMAPLLLPTLAYFVAYALTRFAPSTLRRRFERIDRWLENETGRDRERR